MDSWQILIFNMLILLSSPQETPKPLTLQQQLELKVLFDAGNFKAPRGSP